MIAIWLLLKFDTIFNYSEHYRYEQNWNAFRFNYKHQWYRLRSDNNHITYNDFMNLNIEEYNMYK